MSQIRNGSKRVRKWVARKVWDVGSWLYPYSLYEPDATTAKYFRMEATFIGTEKEADEWFDKLCGLSCGDEHHLHDNCRFVVAGMRSSDLEDDDA